MGKKWYQSLLNAGAKAAEVVVQNPQLLGEAFNDEQQLPPAATAETRVGTRREENLVKSVTGVNLNLPAVSAPSDLPKLAGQATLAKAVIGSTHKQVTDTILDACSKNKTPTEPLEAETGDLTPDEQNDLTSVTTALMSMNVPIVTDPLLKDSLKASSKQELTSEDPSHRKRLKAAPVTMLAMPPVKNPQFGSGRPKKADRTAILEDGTLVFFHLTQTAFRPGVTSKTPAIFPGMGVQPFDMWAHKLSDDTYSRVEWSWIDNPTSGTIDPMTTGVFYSELDFTTDLKNASTNEQFSALDAISLDGSHLKDGKMDLSFDAISGSLLRTGEPALPAVHWRGYGALHYTVEVSTDGVNWVSMESDTDLARAVRKTYHVTLGMKITSTPLLIGGSTLVHPGAVANTAYVAIGNDSGHVVEAHLNRSLTGALINYTGGVYEATFTTLEGDICERVTPGMRQGGAVELWLNLELRRAQVYDFTHAHVWQTKYGVTTMSVASIGTAADLARAGTFADEHPSATRMLGRQPNSIAASVAKSTEGSKWLATIVQDYDILRDVTSLTSPFSYLTFPQSTRRDAKHVRMLEKILANLDPALTPDEAVEAVAQDDDARLDLNHTLGMAVNIAKTVESSVKNAKPTFEIMSEAQFTALLNRIQLFSDSLHAVSRIPGTTPAKILSDHFSE